MTTASRQLLAIGHTPVDIVASAGEAFLAANGLTKGRQHKISLETAEAMGNQLDALHYHAGGAAANVACCFAILGGEAGFDGKCADDALGRFFMDAFEGTGVTPIRPPIADPRGSDHIFVLITPDHERTFAAYYGINTEVSTDELDREAIANSETTFLEGFQLTSNGGGDYLLAAADMARRAGRQVAFAPSDINIIAGHKQACRDLLQYADILIANIAEARALLDMPDSADADDVLAAMRAASYAGGLTFGADGATVYRGDDVHYQPAAAITHDTIVNTNGAGDHFAGGLLYGLTQGHDIGQCAGIGVSLAARCLQRTGARPERGDAEIMIQAG